MKSCDTCGLKLGSANFCCQTPMCWGTYYRALAFKKSGKFPERLRQEIDWVLRNKHLRKLVSVG